MNTLESTLKNFRRDAFYERNHFFVPGDNVIVSFQISGIISEDLLQEAINQMRMFHPMIGTHIEYDENRNAWFVLKGTPQAKLKVIVRKDDKTWINAVLEEYWEPFQISTGPLIRFILIEGDQISDLVVIAQHSICDGLSLVYLLRDIMKYLGGTNQEIKSQHYLPTIKEAYDLDTIKLSPLIKMVIRKVNNLWNKYKMNFDESDYIPMFQAFQTHNLHAITWQLDEITTKKLIEKCRIENISVNSALYCAILTVQNTLQGDKEKFRKNIMMPVNIRNLVTPPIGEGVGLFAGGESFTFKTKWNQNFWNQSKKLHKELVKRLSPNSVFSAAKKLLLFEPGFMNARTMIFLGSLIPDPPQKYQEILKIIEKDRMLSKLAPKQKDSQIQLGSILTNLGVVNIPEEYGHLRLKNVTLLPPNSPLAEKLIGVVTFKNKLQGTITYAEKTLNSHTAEKFAESLVDLIRDLVP